jgi:multidrug efflux pump subunit AcrB
VKTLFAAFVLVVIVVFPVPAKLARDDHPDPVVPISLIGTFAAFSALGFSINTLTLFGLVLAIGIVVDGRQSSWSKPCSSA